MGWDVGTSNVSLALRFFLPSRGWVLAPSVHLSIDRRPGSIIILLFRRCFAGLPGRHWMGRDFHYGGLGSALFCSALRPMVLILTQTGFGLLSVLTHGINWFGYGFIDRLPSYIEGGRIFYLHHTQPSTLIDHPP